MQANNLIAHEPELQEDEAVLERRGLQRARVLLRGTFLEPGYDLHEKVTRGWENCQKGAVKTIPEVLKRLGV